ncbi:hypothetical protein Noda2021_10410 [Candidatus Dependentiae bacterium Noda2021]|nr:hypothetical protein Noda2021_10410 [Candidatus Dependentiae bacterium Noda2021]
MMLKRLVWVGLLVFIPNCIKRAPQPIRKSITVSHSSSKNLNTAIDVQASSLIQPTPTVTVWVHGTRLLPRLFFENFFHSTHGLTHFTDLDERYHLRLIANTLTDNAPDIFNKDHFYIFGWSGKLSFEEREQAAEHLYSELKALILAYINQGHSKPKIRIITHSHGGNVALNLCRYKKPEDNDFEIDELILLACPVQAKTMHLSHDPLFKKIYSLYSRGDLLQVIDPQGLYSNRDNKCSLFSERCFPPHEKNMQVKVKFNGRALMHTEFILPHFLKHFAYILQEINMWDQNSAALVRDWNSRQKLLDIYTDGKRPAMRRKMIS